MTRSTLIGIAAALLAALAWSMNFVVPYVIGDYSVFDFAVFRFVISGAIGFGFLAFRWDLVRVLTLRDWLTAFGLGFIGYVGYFLTVVGAAIFAGPVVAPAFLELVPVVLAITANLRQRVLHWRALARPLILTAAGLMLVNLSVFDTATLGTSRSLGIGIPFAIAAVGLWTWFGIANQTALAERPGMDGAVWTALIIAGGGVEMLAFIPIGQLIGVFEVPRLGLSWNVAAPLYIWGISLAIFASVGGALAWTIATKRLPVTLCAQLIVSETVFGTMFGLAAHGRLPTFPEAGGIVVLTGGVIIAIGAFKRHPNSRL